ncbi:MAG TPA: LamG-like jellyroll fold domain-containing protein [Labilithrix sp.]|nr:LamG-like jellyroll fold domain-containing protein [Labilithrix sp.]
MVRKIVLSLVSGTLVVAGCASVAGVSDYAVDPCFGGTCTDGPVGSDGPSESAPPIDGQVPDQDSGVDAPVDAPPPPSPGKSIVTLSGTGVAVGKVAIATLVARDDADVAVPRTGAKVTFKAAGGTSVVTFGPTVDRGDGTYHATVTGVTEGTKIGVSAVIDGAPLTTTPASLRVVNPVTTGLTLSLDAANADRAGNFGGKGCAAAGLVQWTDLTASSFAGALSGFADPCGATSGWGGTGAPENPFRLTFDGVSDHVDFGAVNALQKYTVLAWIRTTGLGFAGTSGTGGLTNVVPILSKGTAEGETDAIDINYYLGITAAGLLASDYEANPGSGTAPLVGATALVANTWTMVGTTLDASAPTRALWLNGASDGTSVPTLPPSGAASAILTIGGARTTGNAAAACPGAAGSTGCGRFKGDIAVVLTYDHVLTQLEIEKNCHAYSSRFGMLTCPN